MTKSHISTCSQESEDSHTQQTLFGEKKTLHTYSATTTNTAKQSSESTGRTAQSGQTSGNLLPTPSVMDIREDIREPKERTERANKGGCANLREKIGLLPTHPLYSQGDSHVSHSPMRAKGGEKAITAFFGQRCLSASGSSDPHGSLQRMFTESLVLKGDWCSSRCVLTWKKKVTKFGRSLFQLVPSTLPTEGIESGLLLTPNVMDALEAREMEALKKQYKKNRPGRTTLSTLREQIAYEGKNPLLPTPKLLGTPKSQDSRASITDRKKSNMGEEVQEYLIKTYGKITGNKLRLQPAFEEWMMGYPEKWTEFAYPMQNNAQKD